MKQPNKVMPDDLKAMYIEMANLTTNMCKEFCPDLGSCCEPGFCAEMIEEAKQFGYNDAVVCSKTNLCFNGKKCTIPPEFRFMCTVYGANCPYIDGEISEDDPRYKRFYELEENIFALIKKYRKQGIQV